MGQQPLQIVGLDDRMAKLNLARPSRDASQVKIRQCQPWLSNAKPLTGLQARESWPWTFYSGFHVVFLPEKALPFLYRSPIHLCPLLVIPLFLT